MAPAIGGATWRAGWLLFGGLALGAAVTLGGNGVPPADIVAGLRGSAAVRAGAWAAWIGVTLPVARAALVVPGSFWLRSLPVPRAWLWAVHGVGLVACVEAPVGLLLGAGGGLVAGVAAVLVSTAAHALLVARSARARDVALGAALVGAVLASGDERVQLAVAALVVVPALARAVERAPELGHVHRRARVFGGAALALASAHVAALWRRERSVFARGLLVALLGGGAAALGVRNNDVGPGEAARVLLAVGGATLPLASLGLAAAAWRDERRHRWVLDATGTGARTRVAAGAGVVVAWAATLAGWQVAVVAWAAGVAVLAAVAHVAWGAALGAVVAAWTRRVARDDPRDGERLLVGALGVAIASAVGAALGGHVSVGAAWAVGGVALVAQATAPLRAPDQPPAPVEEIA
jgi:hypothetical protein